MRKIKRISIFISVLGLLLLAIVNSPFMSMHSLPDENTYLLDKKLKSDSIFLLEWIKNISLDKNPLDNSPYIIEVFQGDSIVYWNSRAATAKSTDYHLISQWSMNVYAVKMGLEVTALNTSVWAKTHNIFFSKNSEALQKWRDIKINIRSAPSKLQVLLRGSAWFLIFIGLWAYFITGWKNVQYSTQSIPIKYFISALGVLLLFKILNYWSYWVVLFEGFVGFETINDMSILTPNLVHLIINIGLFLIIVFSGKCHFDKIKIKKSHIGLASIIYGLFVMGAFTYFSYMAKGFVLHPSVNLDVDALMEFNHISFVLIICFVIYVITLFQGSVIGNMVLKNNDIQGQTFYSYTFIGLILGLVAFHFTKLLVVPWLMFLIFVMAFILMIDAYVESKEKKITYLIWWLFVFSGFMATVLFYFGLKKDVIERQHFVDNYYSPPVDSLVLGMIEIQDTLVKSNFFNTVSQTDKTTILDYLDIKEYIQNILPDKYASWPISIEMYDKNSGKSLFNNHFSDFYRTKTSLENGISSGKGVVFNPFENKYLRRFEIVVGSNSTNSWYLFLILNPETKVQKTIHPRSYDFAVIQDNDIIFKQDINDPISNENLLRLANESKVQSGYSIVVSPPQNNYKIVSWKKVSGLIKPISLFSFIFTVAGLMLLLLSLFNTRYDFLPESLALKMGARTSLKAKIQLAVIGLILFTFLIIGVITVFYFKNMLEVQDANRYQQENTSIYNNLRSLTQNLSDSDYVLSFLNTKLKDLAFIHDKDLTLYDAQGKLVSSTSDYSHFIRIPYGVWKQNKSFIANYNKDKDKHLDYLPIYVQSEQPMAFVAIDHKKNRVTSSKLTDFLSTILNAYIFLFLVAGALAITIANSITQPLSQLAEKLKKFKLGKTNEKLEWSSNDEIGTLIKDYNNLTNELDKSVNLLAKTERDSAWREMAKQVAHEIKNPLTPMKLSIQYLERTHKDNPEKASELIPRISATLVEQIDNLSQIAGEFSNFATMPQATNEKVSLNEVVETIHDLFRKREDMDIKMNEPIDDLYVFADKNHLVRILNNLLKNAIQAIPDDRRGNIEIELTRQGNEAVIRISDNGVGIPQDKKDKVFTPNFTTKSSGTGLGLAISSNMIESFNGRIYFESTEGQGSDFYVAIPLMKLDGNKESSERVSLD